MRNEESNGPVAATSKSTPIKANNLKINGQKSPVKGITVKETEEAAKISSPKLITTQKKNGLEITPGKTKLVNVVETPIIQEKMEVSTDDDAKLRQSIEELNAANVSASSEPGSTSEKPKKLNTFFGGVRYFASLDNDEEVSDVEPSPFEPSKPRFHTVRRGRRRYDADTGERPYALFGDIEDKINTSGDDDSDAYDASNLTTDDIDDHLNPVVSLEKLDKSFETTLSKPANWANLVINPNAKKPRAPRKTRETSRLSSTLNETASTRPDTSHESTPIGSDNVVDSRLRRTRGKRPKFTEDDDDDFQYAFNDDDEEVDMEPKRKRRRARKRRASEEEDFVPRGQQQFQKAPALPKQLQQAQRVHTIWPKRPVIPARQMLRQKGQSAYDAYDDSQESDKTKSSNVASPPQPAKPKFMETVLVIKPYHQQEKLNINRTMFGNMRFVLTSATRPKADANQSEEEENPPILPFNKRQIRQLIEERSGTVYEDFTHLTDVSNCFLIADTHYRTHKYLSALVRAVPCVLHSWIFECVKENRLLPYAEFLLPAGRSLETNQIIPWHDKCLTLLNGIKMFVHTENKPTIPGALDFTQIWTPIALSMGAIMVDNLSNSIDDPAARFDIFLTDSSCPEDIIAKAKALSATPVSSEWLIQAILTGVLPSTSGHQKYQHDFVEPPPVPSEPQNATVPETQNPNVQEPQSLTVSGLENVSESQNPNVSEPQNRNVSDAPNPSAS